jgi:hypothetical protein
MMDDVEGDEDGGDGLEVGSWKGGQVHLDVIFVYNEETSFSSRNEYYP